VAVCCGRDHRGVDPEVGSLTPDQYTVIGEKVSYRLAQQTGSFAVVKYSRPVIKRLDSQAILCAPAPEGVIDGSLADVSFCAGLTVDRFLLLQNLHFRHPWRSQVRLSHAAISPAPEAGRSRHHGQPAVADPTRTEDQRPARTDLRRPTRFDPRQPRDCDGRDADQGRSRPGRAR